MPSRPGTVLPEQIRTRPGTPITHAWIGTAVIVAFWAFSHDVRGLALAWAIPPAFPLDAEPNGTT